MIPSKYKCYRILQNSLCGDILFYRKLCAVPINHFRQVLANSIKGSLIFKNYFTHTFPDLILFSSSNSTYLLYVLSYIFILLCLWKTLFSIIYFLVGRNFLCKVLHKLLNISHLKPPTNPIIFMAFQMDLEGKNNISWSAINLDITSN